MAGDLYLSPARQNEYCQLSPPTSPNAKASALTVADRKRTPWAKTLDFNISSKVLGNGTFATVHQAEHKVSGEQVAAKVIIKSNIPAEMRYVIMEECNTIAQLDHPNVVRILSGFESPTHIYLMLPLMHGGDMHSFVEKNGRVSERTAFIVFEQLLEAVCHCHDRNVIHRDIKLENILLELVNTDMRIQLTDFGFATLQRTSDPLLDDYPGSPAYAAPELTRGIPYRGRSSDVWAMGVTLYTLVAGQYPFWHEDVDEMYYRIAYATPSFRDEWQLSASLRALLLSMLCKKPDQRPSAHEIRMHPWVQQMGARVTRPPTAPPTPSRTPVKQAEKVPQPWTARKPRNPDSPFVAPLKAMGRRFSSPLKRKLF